MKLFAIILLCFCAEALGADQAAPPMPPSPIAEFRGWLKQSPEERKVALAKRSEKSRRVLEQKIEEYSALPADERERRLGASEMQWYLSRLLGMPKSKRENALQSVPALWQPMVMERLSQWDKMPPAVRQQALQHKLVVEYLSVPSHQQEMVLRGLSSAERNTLMDRIAQWKILPAVERERMDERLRAFFDTQRDRQAETLNSFTDAERQVMSKTLDAFRALPPSQRELCIQSFAQFTSKFAAMSRPEQIAFLKNVERWQEMSQNDRDIWRQVVSVVPPMPELPLPPLPGNAPRAPLPR